MCVKMAGMKTHLRFCFMSTDVEDSPASEPSKSETLSPHPAVRLREESPADRSGWAKVRRRLMLSRAHVSTPLLNRYESNILKLTC